jgi:hypothetical protein
MRTAVVVGLAVLSIGASVSIARPWESLALLTNSADSGSEISTGSIFSGQRLTTAFEIGDASSGSEIDTSSEFAFPFDGRIATTSPWAATFASDRYVEFDLNAPGPAALAVTGATFTFRFSSASAPGVACHYIEVRRISTGVVLATHGSQALPVACATGTTFSASATPIPAIDTTDLANDLRIRVYGSDTAAAGMRVDRATVTGQTAYAAFQLYPVTFRDVADTTPAVVPWELAGT